MKMGEPEKRIEPLPPGASPRSGKPPPVETRWKKGQSGNPGGRPKGESITARLRKVLEGEHNGKVLMDILAERIAKEALQGKHAFIKEVLDRLDGPVNQTHNLKHQNDVRIVIADTHGNEREGTNDDIRAMVLGEPVSVFHPTPPRGDPWRTPRG